MPSSTLIYDTQYYQASRRGKHFVITLKHAHQVLSTSDINGGQTDKLKYLINFQSVEANGHDSQFNKILSQTQQQYHDELAATLNIDATLMASMGTAANINNLVHTQKRFRDITVDAFVTAGVKGNALRAGDQARWYQGDNGNEFIKDAGTINIIVMLNRALTPGAKAKAASIISEAKSAALTELAIPSKQSSHLATGTGTDQYAIASLVNSDHSTLDSASGHLKLGELIGSAVRDAVIEGIGLQNGLERSSTRSVTHALGRFGANEEYLLKKLASKLDKGTFDLLKQNKHSVFRDAKLVAAAYAYAAILDRLHYQTLSPTIRNDVLLDQAANTAMALSSTNEQWQQLRDQLEPQRGDALDLFVQAMAIAWRTKWAQ